MDAKKRSKQFVDISLSFEPHPLTKDLTTLRDARAINNSIKNLIYTIPSEVPFDPYLGSKIHDALFENFSETMAPIIEKEVERTIEFGEPRAEIEFVNVEQRDDQNELRVMVQYRVVGYDEFFFAEVILGPMNMLLNN